MGTHIFFLVKVASLPMPSILKDVLEASFDIELFGDHTDEPLKLDSESILERISISGSSYFRGLLVRGFLMKLLVPTGCCCGSLRAKRLLGLPKSFAISVTPPLASVGEMMGACSELSIHASG
jgi:hypothetical protein